MPKTIFSTAAAPQTRARENLRRLAALIDREYFSLPSFRLRCYADFPGYWRAYHRHLHTTDFVIYNAAPLLETNAEFRAREEQDTPLGFGRGTTLCCAPRLWAQIAEWPATGLITAEQWHVALLGAQQLFQLRGSAAGQCAGAYLLAQALAELGALELLLTAPLYDPVHFAAHPEELDERYRGVLNYTPGLDRLTGVGEYSRLVATLLLWAADCDRNAAYARLRAVYRQPDGLAALVDTFRQAVLGLAPVLEVQNLVGPMFDPPGDPLGPISTFLAVVVNACYGEEIYARRGADALLSLLDLDMRYYPNYAPPSLAALRAQVEAWQST